MFLNTNDRYSLQTEKALCIYDLSCSGHRSSQLSTEWPGRAQSASLISAAGPQESRLKSLSSRLITIRVSGDLESTILSVNISQSPRQSLDAPV